MSSTGNGDDDERDGHAVKIRILPGVPAELENVSFDDDKSYFPQVG